MAREFEMRARELSESSYLISYMRYGIPVGYLAMLVDFVWSRLSVDLMLQEFLAFLFFTALFGLPAAVWFGLLPCLSTAVMMSRLSRSVRGKFSRVILSALIGAFASYFWMGLFPEAFQPEGFWKNKPVETLETLARNWGALLVAGALAGGVSAPFAARRLMRKMRAELQTRSAAQAPSAG